MTTHFMLRIGLGGAIGENKEEFCAYLVLGKRADGMWAHLILVTELCI